MSLKALFILLLLFIVVHVSIKLVPMYIDAERLKDEMSVKARLAQNLKDEEILNDLVKKAKEVDLPLGPDNFVLKRDETGRQMMISTQWDVDVVFLWGAYVRTFHFDPVIEEDYSIHL
ncbi:MAG TPA: hypothetical protein VF888_02235 [Nitrospirota bacterium]